MIHEKHIWKPGNMLYPLPVVLVSCGNREKHNLITIAWTGTLSTNPPMVYISVRPERYSYQLIKDQMEFTLNLVDRSLVYATDFCGVRSGKDIDKFAAMKLTPSPGVEVACPYVAESPLSMECKVKQIIELGSHHMFMAEVLNTDLDGVFERMATHVPIRRIAQPADIAGLFVYLASDDSGFMTGSTVLIDGGVHFIDAFAAAVGFYGTSWV